MKKFKTLLIFMLVASMLLAVGCTAGNNADTATNTTEAVDSQTDESTQEELELDYATGLSQDGFYADVKAMDYVTLSDYKNITIPSENHVITDEQLEASINTVLSNFEETVQVTDRQIKDGDTVNIDYVGSVDGVEFDGGSTGGAGTDVTIGVTQYIDDFLEQLIGHTPGESFDIEVTFPENYGVEDLNGKDAVFAITVNYISEAVAPELTDEFVATNLQEIYECDTVEELRTIIKEDLKKSAIRAYLQNYIGVEVVVNEVPEPVLAYQERMLKNYYEMSAFTYGMKLDDFLSAYVGYPTFDALLEAAGEQVTLSSEIAISIQAIAEDAGLSVSDEYLASYFEQYTGNADYTEYQDIYGIEYLKNSVLQDVVLDYLSENATLAN